MNTEFNANIINVDYDFCSNQYIISLNYEQFYKFIEKKSYEEIFLNFFYNEIRKKRIEIEESKQFDLMLDFIIRGSKNEKKRI